MLAALEADSFWCLSKLLDGIQDNYIFAQPGIVRQVGRMKELCKRVDGESPLAMGDRRTDVITQLLLRNTLTITASTSSSSPSGGSTVC